MPLDEPWNQRGTGQIDHRHVLTFELPDRPDRGDALRFDEHRPVFVDARTVEDPRWLEEDGFGLSARRGRRAERPEREHGSRRDTKQSPSETVSFCKKRHGPHDSRVPSPPGAASLLVRSPAIARPGSIADFGSEAQTSTGDARVRI